MPTFFASEENINEAITYSSNITVRLQEYSKIVEEKKRSFSSMQSANTESPCPVPIIYEKIRKIRQ